MHYNYGDLRLDAPLTALQGTYILTVVAKSAVLDMTFMSRSQAPNSKKQETTKEREEAKGETSELHLAARSGDAAKLAELLAPEEVKELNAPDQHKRTPLHMAAFFGKAEAVAKLLEKGADPQLEAMDGFLALHFAAQSGHVEVLRLLVRKMSSKGEYAAVKRHVNRVVRKGKRTALHLALLKGHSECARFLVQKGASVELQTAQNQTALELCKDEALREELAGKAKEAKVEEAKAEEEEAKAKAAAEDAPSASEPPSKRRKEDPGVGVPMAGLPTAPVTLEKPGVLAAGAWALATVGLHAETEKAYPAGGVRAEGRGVSAMADVEWDLKIKAPEDGCVLCFRSLEEVGERLRLKMPGPRRRQRSSKKLLYYTHFSDEAAMMEKDSRCNACGVTVLLETSDGQLVLQPGTERPWQLPGALVSGCDLAPVLVEALQGLQQEASLVRSARILGLLDAGDAPNGRRHELVAALRLPQTAAQMASELGFAPLRGEKAADVTQVAMEELLKEEEKLSAMQSRAVGLLQALLNRS
ncbi:unnamed protein product [Effrenium voratum]|nr:unnamed protein product [Effrenium voratum]